MEKPVSWLETFAFLTLIDGNLAVVAIDNLELHDTARRYVGRQSSHQSPDHLVDVGATDVFETRQTFTLKESCCPDEHLR